MDPQGLERVLGDLQWWQLLLVLGASFQGNGQASSCYKPTLRRADVLTVHGCRKHDVKSVISTVVPLTALAITNSEIFPKLWLYSKGIALVHVTGHYQHVVINL